MSGSTPTPKPAPSPPPIRFPAARRLGPGPGSASYGTGTYNDSTNVTVTNNDTVSTVDVTPNSTVSLAEGGSQPFKALATFSDGCTEQVACGGLLGATTWTVTGNLTWGACASQQQTVNAAQIPCGAGGSGTVNASYSSVSDATATAVTVTNNDSISSVLLTPVRTV